MADKPRYYVTTAISYPNGAPHIGHAYEAIATDAIARFQRLDGYDVFFQTGVDEHGLKMVQTAAKEGISPRDLSNRNTPLFKAMCDKLNISYDRFIRTTEEAHYKSSQAIWQKMADAGDIYLGNYEGWYSVRDEAFYAESETTVGEDKVRRARRARRSSGRRKKPISSSSRPIRTSCSLITRSIRISFCRRRAATKS